MKIPDTGTEDRLDRWLAQLAGISRTEARRRIQAGAVYVQGSRCRRASRPVGPGDSLRLESSEAAPLEGPMPRFEYRDDQLAILWKPPGMAVQATRGSVHGTLEAWLREQRRVRYCAFHHRLDRDARGLLAVALHRSANRGLAEAFSQRTVRRRYRILVHGRPVGEEGSWRHRERVEGRDRSAQPWTDDGKGREMSARWSLLEQRGSRSLLEVQLATGRTHQIRLQAAAEGLPVVGDRLYGFGERSGLRLQAFSLELAHPVTGEAVACVLEEPSDWLRGPGTPEP